MVVAVGRPRLLSFIFGLVCVFFAVGLILFEYSYLMDLSIKAGNIVLGSSHITQLFLFFFVVLFLGLLGGFEIGRFIGISKEKRT